MRFLQVGGSSQKASTSPKFLGLGADLEACETAHGETRLLQHLTHGQLVVTGVVLVQQSNLLEEGAEAALHNLRQRSFGLSFVAADFLDEGALLVDHVSGNLVTRDVLGVGEGDVLSYAPRGLGV